MRIVLLFTLLLSVTAQECRVSNGVEYVKIDGNFQPDGCPDGLKCINKVCSSVTTVTDKSVIPDEDKNDGQLEGLPCAVYQASDSRSIVVFQKDDKSQEDGNPYTYSSGGCGSKDGTDLTCVGDWGEHWEECTLFGTEPSKSKDCKPGCDSTRVNDNMCDVGVKYDRGTCRYEYKWWAAGPLIFIGCIIVAIIIVLIAYALGCFKPEPEKPTGYY